MLRFLNRKKVLVLMYHGIVPDNCPIDAWTFVKESEFRKQMDILAQYYDVVPINRIKEVEFPTSGRNKPTAIITFDDGYKNNYTHAFPILKEYGFPATVFVCSGLINKKDIFWYDKVIYSIQRTSCEHIDIGNKRFSFKAADTSKRWDRIQELLTYLKTKNKEERTEIVEALVNFLHAEEDQQEYFILLSFEEIHELQKSDLVTIGAHTTTHEILTGVSIEFAERIIADTVNDTKRLFGENEIYFSYPNGDYNRDIFRILHSHSIELAFTTVNELYAGQKSRYEIPRIGIGGYDDIATFSKQISGLSNIISLPRIKAFTL